MKTAAVFYSAACTAMIDSLDVLNSFLRWNLYTNFSCFIFLLIFFSEPIYLCYVIIAQNTFETRPWLLIKCQYILSLVTKIWIGKKTFFPICVWKRESTISSAMGLFSKLLVGMVGFYAGVYCDQNYKLPSVSEPAQLLDEVNKWLEEYKNAKSKVRTGCFCRFQHWWSFCCSWFELGKKGNELSTR